MAAHVTLIDIPAPQPINPIKDLVGEILGLAPSLNHLWDIVDIYPNADDVPPRLALAHYMEDYDPLIRLHEPLRRVRGTIVDLATKAIICDSYGHTQTLPCHDAMTETYSSTNPKGQIMIPTSIAMYVNPVSAAPEEVAKVSQGVRPFEMASTKLFLGYEGALVRIFKWDNKVFFSTHRKIDALNSSWGGRTSFHKLYTQLGGPAPESFFGEEPYSPYCYMLLVTHDDIRLATSTRDNRIIYIGMKKLWEPEKLSVEGGAYAWKGEFKPKIPEVSAGKETLGIGDRKLIVQPTISVNVANKFLFPDKYAKEIPVELKDIAKDNEMFVQYNQDGSKVEEIYSKRNKIRFADERLGGGDFLIVYTQAVDGQTIVYRLESPGYEYRVGITGNDSNLYHQFVVKMVEFTKAKRSTLLEAYPKYLDGSGKELTLDQPANRRVYWWSLFHDAAAPAYKAMIEKFYNQYNSDIEKVAKFIWSDSRSLAEKIKSGSGVEEGKRINEMTMGRFENLRGMAERIKFEDKSRSPVETIRGLLLNETGKSFYRMITSIKNLEKLKTQQQKAAGAL